ncbi:glycosyltransferase [Alicyclobacillus fodiniaquatilis]|uniref:Glycosyltransferase n=1 Tax=Alicyclobacillus fodiniaquatilis TaxID=1661150 RepID=A0ABW4JQL4_9BACL
MSHIRDVGIVLPIYKQKRSYVRKAIHSILKQKYKYFKLVIVIDGAPKHIEKLVRREVKRDPRVRIIVQKNKGVAAALNRGFRSLSRRKHIRYLTWVSSDNIYYPDYLRKLRRKLRHSPAKVGLAYSTFKHIGTKGEAIYDKEVQTGFGIWQDQPVENLPTICFIGTSFMYKRRYADKIGPYRLEPVEDYDYWLRLTDHCGIAYVHEELMGYRVASDYSISKTLSSSPEQHRRWHYAFQLTKKEALARKGIPVQTTIIVPVSQVTDTVMQRLEALYEQYYSNFEVWIIDGTGDEQARATLSSISDPRVAILPVAEDAHTAARRIAAESTTPYVLFYDAQQAGACPDLQALHDHLTAAPDNIASVKFDHAIGDMITQTALTPPVGCDELFKRQALQTR